MFDQICEEIELKGFCTLPQIISSKEILLINEFFSSHVAEFKPAQVGIDAQRRRIDSIRGDYTLWLNTDKPPIMLNQVFVILNNLKQHLNQKLFLGIRDIEAHLAVYPPGSFYARHRDRHEKKSTRVLSFVFYLNQEWNDADGGELILYNQENKELLKLLPAPGTFVCFLSDEFPHEVKTAYKERRSLTGWMHCSDLD